LDSCTVAHQLSSKHVIGVVTALVAQLLALS
jgi:hypothetical protein